MIQDTSEARDLPDLCNFEGFAHSLRDSNGCLTSVEVHQEIVDKTPAVVVSRARTDPDPNYYANHSTGHNVGGLDPIMARPAYGGKEPLVGTRTVLPWP